MAPLQVTSTRITVPGVTLLDIPTPITYYGRHYLVVASRLTDRHTQV
jgi:hypothetical protein